MSKFLKKQHNYKNLVDPINQYVKVAANFIKKTKELDDNIEVIESKIKKLLKEKFEIKNPKVKFRERDLKGDVTTKTTSLYSYIKYPKKTGHIIVPSFTVYFKPEVKRSLHSDFIDENVKERNKHKKLAFKYEIEGEIELFKKHNTIQKTKKIFNNSLSGAYASSGTILYNPSAHYTLTSITRCVSGTGNSQSEVIISGNLHLATPEIALNYIATIITFMNRHKLLEIVKKYNLYIPTPEEVLSLLLKSTRKYWQSKSEEEYLLNFLKRLSKLELVWVAYLNNLYAIREFNSDLLREFFDLTLRKPDISKIDTPKEEMVKFLNDHPEYLNMLHHLRADVLMGKEPIYDKLELNDIKELYGSLKYAIEAFDKFDDLLTTFLMTDLLPINIAYIKNMLREVIVLSDTDSTCATYEDWVEWYFGENKFSVEGMATTGVIMTITATAVDHGIKVFAANMNIPKDRVHGIAMKNEFYWDVFVPTNVSKHYFADYWIKEGNVRKSPKNETKGVNLLAPNAYSKVRDLEDWLRNDIFRRVRNKEKIPMRKYLKKVMLMEKEIIEKVYQGSADVLRLDKIKDKDAYKLDQYHSPYFHYLLWQRAFSKKYGNAPDPTFVALKVNVTTDSKTRFKEFLNSLEDEEIKEGLISIMKEAGKDSIGTFRFPLANVMEKGLPKEVIPFIDIDRIVFDNCNPLYMVLESIGYYKKPKTKILDIELELAEELE